MDLPAVRLLLLTKEERSLKDHTTDFFLDLAFHTHYPDSALISYYWTRLNKEVKAKTPFPSDGPRGKFIYFVEPVLFSCGGRMKRMPPIPYTRNEPRAQPAIKK